MYSVEKNSESSNFQNMEKSQKSLLCNFCFKELSNPQLLSCFHVFCFRCLKDIEDNKSNDLICPICKETNPEPKPERSISWSSFEKYLENEKEEEKKQKRLSEIPTSELANVTKVEQEEEEDDEYENMEIGHTQKRGTLQAPSLFPCSLHSDKLADTFCMKCNQLTCHKCVSSFHRRCKLLSLPEAVLSKQPIFSEIHSNIAKQLVQCDEVKTNQNTNLKSIEEMRTKLLINIKKFRTELINLIYSKEKELCLEVNNVCDDFKQNAIDKQNTASKLYDVLFQQISVMDLSMSIKGEAELLQFLPNITEKLDTNIEIIKSKELEKTLNKSFEFIRDKKMLEDVQNSKLGVVQEIGVETKTEVLEEEKTDLELSLVSSFHGGTRDDITEPLLTDLIVLANGDVILTDRDNKCVKKFNQSGNLLTRVVLQAIPSRITATSHARACVSVMNKKSLFFLSLFGTIRVLDTVRTKKLYSFITSLGNGVIAACTSEGNCIDLITENGVFIKTIFTQKLEKSSISRPLYLTPGITNYPVSKIILSESIDKSGNKLSNEKRRSLKDTEEAIKNKLSNEKRRNSKDTEETKFDLLVSDSGKRIIFGLNQESTLQKCTFKSGHDLFLDCPLGITAHESGYILLVDRDADSILVVNHTGSFVKNALTVLDGLAKPCAIYAGKKGEIALTQVDGWVKVYKSRNGASGQAVNQSDS